MRIHASTSMPLHFKLMHVVMQTTHIAILLALQTLLIGDIGLGVAFDHRYDLLIRYRLHIVGETSLAINHCLVALPGTKLKDIKRVMSHPQVSQHNGLPWVKPGGRVWLW
jgi:hypothetical protein